MSLRDQTLSALANRYTLFADEEARGSSPLYEALSRGVAGDEDVLSFLAGLPPAKQQPNLLLAAVRHLFGVRPDWISFRDVLLGHAEAVASVMLARSTQTNEAARCAVLLPLLAQLPQPLALIEVGASAGLCLLPDFYGYNYGRFSIRPDRPGYDHPVFSCAADMATPLPTIMPRIAWRAGLDLNPIDVTDLEQAAWLETLVWPEQETRLSRLREAVRIAAARPPRIVKGDLMGDALPSLCREAPSDATLVVFHTAVLVYVQALADREAFAGRMASLAPYWISNEAIGVLPAIDQRAGQTTAPGRFVLSLNGEPKAWTDAHGQALEWNCR